MIATFREFSDGALHEVQFAARELEGMGYGHDDAVDRVLTAFGSFLIQRVVTNAEGPKRSVDCDERGAP